MVVVVVVAVVVVAVVVVVVAFKVAGMQKKGRGYRISTEAGELR